MRKKELGQGKSFFSFYWTYQHFSIGRQFCIHICRKFKGSSSVYRNAHWREIKIQVKSTAPLFTMFLINFSAAKLMRITCKGFFVYCSWGATQKLIKGIPQAQSLSHSYFKKFDHNVTFMKISVVKKKTIGLVHTFIKMYTQALKHICKDGLKQTF